MRRRGALAATLAASSLLLVTACVGSEADAAASARERLVSALEAALKRRTGT